jgi:hypothetical protein
VLLHVIYTETDMLLSKRLYASWREIQDRYETYKASVGPWEHPDVIAYLNEDYSDLLPNGEEQVQLFIAGTAEVCILTFQDNSSLPNA